MTKDEFKKRWESSDDGDGLTYEDIADCAIAWGVSRRPKTCRMDSVLYRVLVAAGVTDAQDYAPETN